MRSTFGRGSYGRSRIVGYLTRLAAEAVGEAVSARSLIPYILMLGGLLASVAVMVTAIFIFINCNRVWIKHHPSSQTPFDQIGPFIGGISLFFATLVAWITAFLITWRNARQERYMNAVNSFRALYQAFWTPDDIAYARKWIISEDEYANVLKPVLENRNLSEFNQLDEAQNAKLEILDKFLAVLVRIKSFSVSGELDYIPEAQRTLWRKVIHGSFWVAYAYKHRPELWYYIYEHWDELLPQGAPRVPDPTRELKWEDLL
jgi:hypothetical protein